jgi:2-dehydropantoate 2-reductase
MRYIIYGAGAIGGVIGARLFQAGHDVVLICRGAHLDAIRRSGLRLRTPDEDLCLPVPAVSHPSELRFGPDDTVILTMKTQDTEQALADLEAAAGPEVPVICCQNGVENERMAARRFARVYAMLVAMPATFLEPGQVDNECAPVSGVLDIGVYPAGVDDLAVRVAAGLSASRIDSRPHPRIMRFKYAKLLHNLANAVQVVTGELRGGDGLRRLAERLRAEAVACYAAAGIDYASEEEYQAEIQSRYRQAAIAGRPRGGSSTWQSLVRGRPTLETDYLNGEIVLLGRLYGIPTPANALIRRLANQMAASGEQPGRYPIATIEALMAREGVVP